MVKGKLDPLQFTYQSNKSVDNAKLCFGRKITNNWKSQKVTSDLFAEFLLNF